MLRSVYSRAVPAVRAIRAARVAVPLVPKRLASSEPRVASDFEQSTGSERIEIEALKAGVEDPFMLKGIESSYFGTKYRPICVPSFNDERLVGCVGLEEHEHEVAWVNLKTTGEISRCPTCAQAFAGYKVSGDFYPKRLEA